MNSNKTLPFDLKDMRVSVGTPQQVATQQLTTMAVKLADSALEKLNAQYEEYSELFNESRESHAAMDQLIDELKLLDGVEADFLKDLDEKSINGILKSQQSKRSRAKNKNEMTLENYHTMLVGAICENIIRDVRDMPKNHTAIGGRSGKSIFDYTPEEIQALGDDQEALRRMIRNVQSQKSIAKSKDDFDETSEKWLSLLKIEAVLKDLRVALPTSRKDKTKDKLKELLADCDIEHLKAADSKELLKAIAGIIDDEKAHEDETTEEDIESVDNVEEAEDNE